MFISNFAQYLQRDKMYHWKKTIKVRILKKKNRKHFCYLSLLICIGSDKSIERSGGDFCPKG